VPAPRTAALPANEVIVFDSLQCAGGVGRRARSGEATVRTSLNQTVIDLLRQSLGINGARRQRHQAAGRHVDRKGTPGFPGRDG
jgi:hypothetical protein